MRAETNNSLRTGSEERNMREERLAEYVSPGEARRRGPNLADLDRLAEIMPPRRIAYWPYLFGVWNVG